LLSQVSKDTGARDLLEGRVAMQQARFDDARAHWERAEMAARLAGTPLSPEIEVEAMGHLARLFSMRGLDASGWFQRVDDRCVQLNAAMTRSAFQRLRRQTRPDVQERRLERTSVAIKAYLLDTYAEPFTADVAKLGPVPLHVHGMAKSHANDPNKYVNAVGTMASLLWREGDRQRAYETAWYGKSIARRLWGEPVEAVLQTFIDSLLAPLPPERRGAFETRLRINALGKSEA
jgi:hypothetical protein